MKLKLVLLIYLIISNSYCLALDIDVDNNNAVDVAYGGTNLNDLSTDVQALLDDPNFATMRTTLGLEIGTNVQAYDVDLSSAAAGSEAGNSKFFGTSGAGAVGWIDQSTISGGPGITDGTASGDLTQWDGDSWEPISSLTNMTISGGTANRAAVWDGDGKLSSGARAEGVLDSGTNPTVDAAGELAIDTDGANIAGDMTLRAYDSTNTVALGRKLHDIHVTVVAPNDLADAVRDAFLVWSNETGMVFTVTQIKAWSGTDNTTLNVELTDSNGANNATIEGLEIATDGTGLFYTSDTDISGDATVAAGQLIWLDFDDTDTPTWVKVTITGWFNAAVD